MTASAASWPKFQEYTWDLSTRVQQASKSSLAQFQSQLNTQGYEWLTSYIDNIEAHGPRAPIADLIKTPSRTATAKKTRANTAASEARTGQVRRFNLALSPMAKSPDVRQPLSPLGARDLNTMALSPTKSTLKSKGGKPVDQPLSLEQRMREARSPTPKATAKPASPARKAASPTPKAAASTPRNLPPISVVASPSPKQATPKPPSQPMQEKVTAPRAPSPEEEKVVKPAGPTRQVRSSWLSQALGSRTVPLGELAGAERKSIAPSASILQKSQAAAPPPAKRKSETQDELDKGDKRAEKMARFDPVAATDAESGRPISPRPASATRPQASAKSLPASASVTTPGGGLFVDRGAASVPHDARRDRVMSKLEEMRERNAAAAAAKQQKVTGGGTGFLRNLGAALGFNGTEVEVPRNNLASSQAKEEAEEELDRVLRAMAEEEKEAKRKAEETAAMIAEPAPILAADIPHIAQPSSEIDIVPDEEDESQAGDIAIVVDADDEDEDAVNDSVNLPSLPAPDSDYEMDDDEPKGSSAPASALAAAGVQIKLGVPQTGKKSTTPPWSPPRATSSKIPMSPRGMAKAESSRPPSQMSDVSTQSSALSQTDRIASKILGVKANIPPVRSVQAAQMAFKKEQEKEKGRAGSKMTIEQRKQERARREEEERRAAEAEERRRRQIADAKKLNESTKRLERVQKEREALNRDEERKHKAPSMLAKSTGLTKSVSSSNLKGVSTLTKPTASSAVKAETTIKRVIPPAPTSAAPGPSYKGKESVGGPKTFRTAPPKEAAKAPPSAPTTPGRPVQKPILGPPQRTSAVPGPSRTAAAPANPGSTLQQSRLTLQAQLAQKAAGEQSEDIELPEIASEYSDSDEEKSPDFKRPAWAESPELKALLERQSKVNPDDLFGAIRPLNMEELFQARAGKFRARTSSANWTGTDRLTEAEEREYAKRMGFKPLDAPGASDRF